MLCRLVAHHSCAIIEAEERGLADVLHREFEPAPEALASALTFCDMTTSPDGESVHVNRRLAEIHDRYGSGHLVSRSIHRATPLIVDAVDQVNAKACPDCLTTQSVELGVSRPFTRFGSPLRHSSPISLGRRQSRTGCQKITCRLEGGFRCPNRGKPCLFRRSGFCRSKKQRSAKRDVGLPREKGLY
jgi:hypothetical protein